MDLAWLEDFLALADCGNFSRAAAMRHLTQPAFSRRIRALEDWAGAALFDRASQPVALTEAGQRFRATADETLRRLYQGRDEARRAQAAAAATLRFAATHSLSLTFFPEWLRRLEAQAPVASVRLDSDTMAACEQLLAHGHSQFLLCHHHAAAPERLDPRQFRSAKVGEDLLVPVTAPAPGGGPRHALPGRADAPLPFLAYAEASAIARAIAAALAGRELWLNEVFVSPQAAVLEAMARAGRGLAWMPHSLVGAALAAGTLVAAGGDDWTVAVEIRLFRPHHRLSPAAEAFWSLLGPGGG